MFQLLDSFRNDDVGEVIDTNNFKFESQSGACTLKVPFDRRKVNELLQQAND